MSDGGVNVLRGWMRTKLMMGVDHSVVAFRAMKIARQEGLSDAEVRGVFDDLKAEGLLPS